MLDYFTDVIKVQSVKFIEDTADSPMFMYIATPSPHRPATPAPQYDNKFIGQFAPRTPSYNVTSRDKHWIISEGKRLCGQCFVYVSSSNYTPSFRTYI